MADVVVTMGAWVRCKVCKTQREVAIWVADWECEECLAGERPEGQPRPGICRQCGALRPHVYEPTAWGPLCYAHLVQTCRRAVWPRGWP